MPERRPDDLELARAVLTRCRKQGLPFEQAWERALEALPAPEYTGGGFTGPAARRVRSLRALRDTEDAWRRGYERVASPDPSVLGLADLLS